MKKLINNIITALLAALIIIFGFLTYIMLNMTMNPSPLLVKVFEKDILVDGKFDGRLNKDGVFEIYGKDYRLAFSNKKIYKQKITYFKDNNATIEELCDFELLTFNDQNNTAKQQIIYNEKSEDVMLLTFCGEPRILETVYKGLCDYNPNNY